MDSVNRFARFVGIAHDDPSIEQHRANFAHEVIALAAESPDRGTFQRKLEDELHAAELPVPMTLAAGMVFVIHSLPLGLILKVQPIVGSLDNDSIHAEVKFYEQYPRLSPRIYGHHIHKADPRTEAHWGITIVQRVLPYPALEKFLTPIVSDCFKKPHWGVEYGTGRLVLIDAGGANTDLPTRELPF